MGSCLDILESLRKKQFGCVVGDRGFCMCRPKNREFIDTNHTLIIRSLHFSEHLISRSLDEFDVTGMSVDGWNCWSWNKSEAGRVVARSLRCP